jgi:hypothetical protein
MSKILDLGDKKENQMKLSELLDKLLDEAKSQKEKKDVCPACGKKTKKGVCPECDEEEPENKE